MTILELMRAQGLLNTKNELLLYGVIGDWWEGMDALSIVRELEKISGDDIVVRIHSEGGRITDGLAMYNHLVQSDKSVTVYIDGVCASMATVVAMAASPGKLYTPDNALWMVHNPHNELRIYGHAEEIEDAADQMVKALETFKKSVTAAYTANGRVTAERLEEIFATGKDFIMTGAEAVAEGFADALTAESVTAAAALDLSKFQATEPRHQQLFSLYAVNAAPTPHRNQEDPSMKLKQKLLALQAALTAQGIAATEITAALASAFNCTAEDIDNLLSDSGNPTDAQLRAGIDALNAMKSPVAPATDPAPANPGSVDVKAEIRADRQRTAAINKMASKFDISDEQRDDWIESDMTLEAVNQQVINHLQAQDRSAQPASGLRLVDTSGDAFKEDLAAAMLHKMQPGTYKMEGGSLEFRGMRLLDMAAMCLDRVGVSTRGKTPNEIAALALQTTSDFPNVVADVANKVLLTTYTAAPRTFLNIAGQVNIGDFKLRHAVEVGGGSGLEKVGESGEIKHGKVSESKRSYKLSTYAKIFTFSRQLLINDDIGALNRFLMQLGALVARNENATVWALVKAGAIYSSGNGNLVTSGGAVGDAQLDKVRKLFRKQKGLDNEPLNLSMTHIAVPTERETEARKALSAVLAATTTDVNDFANAAQLIVEPLLDDVSNNPWYAFADSMLAPTLEYAYLEGEQGPYIETRNGFDVEGIQVKVRHDFGAGWVSHRGSVKNPGA